MIFLLNVVVLLGTFNHIKTLGSTSGVHVLSDFFSHWFCVFSWEESKNMPNMSLLLPLSQTEMRETEGKETKDRQEEGEL